VLKGKVFLFKLIDTVAVIEGIEQEPHAANLKQTPSPSFQIRSIRGETVLRNSSSVHKSRAVCGSVSSRSKNTRTSVRTKLLSKPRSVLLSGGFPPMEARPGSRIETLTNGQRIPSESRPNCRSGGGDDEPSDAGRKH
jgi:hypothetical protein